MTAFQVFHSLILHCVLLLDLCSSWLASLLEPYFDRYTTGQSITVPYRMHPAKSELNAGVSARPVGYYFADGQVKA